MSFCPSPNLNRNLFPDSALILTPAVTGNSRFPKGHPTEELHALSAIAIFLPTLSTITPTPAPT